ncbi:MAG TPA: GNAT family protein [Dehalococcoidia bacterium]|nr:GNAT family protein [Dehalococcoidia bacterium]
MLRGEKVVLRSLEREDLPAQWAWNNDLETEVAGGGDPPMPQPLARLQADFDREAAKGGRDDANFAIETEGKLIGACGLFNWNAADRTCELGIGIGDKAYWGRGYGRDAVRTLVEYAFRYRNQRKVFLRVWGNNERGIRSYRSVGFVEEGRLREHVWSAGRYVDLVYMGVLRSEWPGAMAEG